MDNEGRDERWSHMRGGEAARGEVRYIQHVLKERRTEQGSKKGWVKAKDFFFSSFSSTINDS